MIDLLFSGISLASVISTIVFAILGVLLLVLSYWIFDKITPFCLTTELQKEKNLAISIVLGSVFISIAIIVSGVIQS